MLTLENLKAFLHSSPTPSIILYADIPAFTIAAHNDAFVHTLGHHSGQHSGKSLLSLFTGQVSASQQRKREMRNALENVCRLKTAHQMLLQQYDLSDGSGGNPNLLFWKCNSYPILDEHGEVHYIVQHFEELSGGVAERQERPLFDDYPDAIFTLNTSGTFLTANKVLLEIADCSFDTLTERSFLPFVVAEELEKVTYNFNRVCNGEVVSYETRVLSAMQKEHVLQLTTMPIFINDEVIEVYVIAKDITARKNIEHQLESEKLKYQELFDLNPLPQFIYNTENLNFLQVNEAAVQAYGYSREEFLQMKISDIRPPEDLAMLLDILGAIERGMYKTTISRHLTRSGQIIHVLIEGRPVSYDDQNARIVVVVDQTEKLKVQQAIELSEKRFRSLVQEGSDIMDVVDPEGNYLYIGANSTAILGKGADFFIGRNAFEFIHEEDKKLVADALALVLVQKRVQMEPFRFNVGGDEYRWIETVLTNMLDEPSVAGIIANSRDVTERIANETKTQQSIERYNIVSKATSDAIWDWDMTSDQMTWNKGITGIFGHRLTNASRGSWYNLVHPRDLPVVIRKIDLSIKNKKSRLEVEYRFKCSDGSYKVVLDRSFLMFNRKGEPIRMIGSMQDVTEMKNTFREINEQNLRLKDISWMQSHSVRSPVARIKGLTSLLMEGDMDDVAYRDCLQYLMVSTSELDTIICDIIKKTEGLPN